MTKSNLLNTRSTNFLEMVGNGRIYRVPSYQRDYSWTEEQWEDLWSDILELNDRPEDRHYMGALVVEAKTDREFLIIDGQQRLATLSILSLAVIEKLGRLAVEGVEAEKNQERARALRSRFIGEKDPASLVESSKLFLNQTDNAFYQDYLVQLRPPINPKGLQRSNRLLWECFKYFSERLNALVAFQTNGEKYAELLSETVGHRLMFILINVDDELNAYTVFETLNARGLELSATDLLKNYLFSRLAVTADLEVLQRRWKALIQTVQQEKFPEFLRYHLLCEQPKIRSQRLFKIVRDKVKTPQEVFGLMEALETRAELFAALSDPDHGYWIETPACRPFIKELNLFHVRQMTPLLFAAWEKYSKEEFTSLLRIISVLSFRYSVVSGINTNALEPASHDAAKAVLNGTAKTASALGARLKSIYVDDDKFREDFSRFSVDTSGQRKKLAKYILARLESDSSGKACDPETDPATIEHILPENPEQSWESCIPRESWEGVIYRLGNLTLLERSINSAVSNVDFSNKLGEYPKSTYSLARAIPVIAPSEWTLSLIDERQKKMAVRAVHIWRINL